MVLSFGDILRLYTESTINRWNVLSCINVFFLGSRPVGHCKTFEFFRNPTNTPEIEQLA